jgi:hypothetical protein
MNEKYARELLVLSHMEPYKNIRVDTYEYESVGELIEQAQLPYMQVIDILNDKKFKVWFLKKHKTAFDKLQKGVKV